MSEWKDALAGSWLGRIVRGIIKIALGGVIMALLNNINIDLSNVNLGGTTVDLSIIWTLIKVFGPLLLIISGFRDLDVKL